MRPDEHPDFVGGIVVNGEYVHACYHYRTEKGEVFVDDSEWDWWKVVEATSENVVRAIRCSKCDKPAVRLDHLYPYDREFNRCADHSEAKG